MNETWMLDELAHAGPEHLDEGFIAGYDRKQGYPDPAADIAAFEAHGLGNRSAVVDLGAGTGQFAIPAAARFGRVTALRRIAGMLRPGGVLRLLDLVYDFAPGETGAVFADWFAKRVLDRIKAGESLEISEYGRTVARLLPATPTTGAPLLDRLIAQGRAVPAANPGPIPPTPPRAAAEKSVSLSAALAEMRDDERY